MNFTQLGLTPAILSALRELDYATPTPIQEGAIPPALEGRDVLGIAQTGTGKTCAFATPILQRLAQAHYKGPRVIRALILTPTRELALQIQESFEHYGAHMPLRSAVIFGGVGQQPQVDKIKRGLDILVATPGRLLDLQGQGLLDLSHVEIFVLDEADRMLDMGFIHDVRRVLKLLPEKKQTLFFSATMPPEVTELVGQLLHDPARVAVTPVSSPVEAIRQSLYFVDRKNKTKLLALLVDTPEVKNALVFSRTKHGANKIAQDLQKAGISSAAIHGNKSQTARVQALSDFKAGRVKVLVATDIAARGIDIEDLSHVFNYNLPDVPETYVHRIGRTGRAGREGVAISFCEFGEKDDLKGVEKLLGHPIPVVEDHPYPMEVFEAPKRDKNGRIVNAEDQEARQAAREKKAQRAAQKPQKQPATPSGPRTNVPISPAPKKAVEAPSKGKEKVSQKTPSKKPKPAADTRTPGEKRRSAGYKPSRTLDDALRAMSPKESSAPAAKTARDEAFERWMAEERAIQAGRAAQAHDPLAGDAIMDATARLLAPKREHSGIGLDGPERGRAEGRDAARRPARDGGKPSRNAANASVTSPKPRQAQPQRDVSKREGTRTGGNAPKRQEAGARSKPARSEKPARPAKPSASSLEDRKAKIREEARARRARGPMEPTLRPSTQKDSTEQNSLMKPYYLGDDE